MMLQCNTTEDDRCELFDPTIETLYIKVNGSAIDGASTQMVFDLMVLESNNVCLPSPPSSSFSPLTLSCTPSSPICVPVRPPDEVQRLMTERKELVHTHVSRNHRMKVWWHATLEADDEHRGAADAVTVFRYDVPAAAAAARVPPPHHYMTACSLQRWMQPDPAAQETVRLRTTPTAEVVGSAVVGNLSAANTTYFAVVATRGHDFGAAYQVLRCSAATAMTTTTAAAAAVLTTIIIATLLFIFF